MSIYAVLADMRLVADFCGDWPPFYASPDTLIFHRSRLCFFASPWWAAIASRVWSIKSASCSGIGTVLGDSQISAHRQLLEGRSAAPSASPASSACSLSAGLSKSSGASACLKTRLGRAARGHESGSEPSRQRARCCGSQQKSLLHDGARGRRVASTVGPEKSLLAR